jgi:AAA family ATP:ADP antiporter
MSLSGDNSEFSPWRRWLWPVHHYELKKLIPMLLIFFLISFNYNVLRTLKDSLLITAKSSGAEVIPFVKVWAMFPGAILMTLLFTWLSNRYSREAVFYIMLSIFLAYFCIFTFILFPLRDIIHPHAMADSLEILLPVGLKGLIAMFRYWTFTIFYVMSELWGSSILFVVFWGFANQVTKLDEAKRFYGLFGVGANFSGIFAGQASVFCCHIPRFVALPFGEDTWHQSLILIISMTLISGLLAIALFRWINTKVLTDPRFFDAISFQKEKQTKETPSLKQSFAILLRSRYLLCIALVVISYQCVINLTEVMWKSEVRELYPNSNDYTAYMNNVVSIIGLIATLSSLFVSGNAVRKCGWTFTAMVTPVIILLTSLGFFGFFFLKKLSPEWVTALLGLSPLTMVVFFGTSQNVLCRAAKYSVFDATKEMTFVPLNKESKIVGKAVIDGVCSRLGKSSGSVIYQSLLLAFSTIPASAPYVALFLLAIICIWMIAIRALGRQFAEVTTEFEESLVLKTQLVPIRTTASLLSEESLLKEKQAI